MNDPLTDERALMLLSALPDEISAMGQRFTLLSLSAGTTASDLNSLKGSDWQGDAADVYRNRLATLPTQLHNVSNSYDIASGALDTFGMDLSWQKPRFELLAGRLRTARSKLAAAQAKLNAAELPFQDGLLGTVAARQPGAPSLKTEESNRSIARFWVNLDQDDVTALERQCFHVLDAFDHSRRTASSGLRAAIESEPTNREVLPTPAAGRLIEGIFTNVGDAFAQLGPDALAWWHHKSAKNLGKVAEDFGTVAATIGTAAAIAAFPADGPLAAALDAIAEGGDVAFDGTLGIRTTTDGYRVLRGEGGEGDLIDDVVTAGLDGGGKIVTHDADAALEGVTPSYLAVTHLEQALDRYPGESVHDVVVFHLSTDDRLTLQESGVDLNSASERTAYAGIVKGAFKAAEREARRLEAVNGAIQYGGGTVVDTTKDNATEGEH